MMRVLITGHRGYIGPWAVHLFQNAGHRVTGCDVGLFDGCAFDNNRGFDGGAASTLALAGVLPSSRSASTKSPA